MKSLKDIMKKRYGNSEQDIILHGADIATAQGYTNIPNHVLYSGTISSHAKLVYTMLLSYAYTRNQVYPGQERLAKQCGLSVRTVYAALKELDTRRFITILRRGQGRTNLYILNLKKR